MDIGFILENGFGTIRTITKEGPIYVLHNKMTLDRLSFIKMKQEFVKEIRINYANLVEKAILRIDPAPQELDQLLVDLFMEKLLKEKHVEYIKYK